MILTGWKEIANYLRSGVRTAQRWTAKGLPVERSGNGRRAPVTADSEQLDIWLRGASNGASRYSGIHNEIQHAQRLLRNVVETQTVMRARLRELQKEIAVIQAKYMKRPNP